MRLRIGLPKGSLQEATLRLMQRAGYQVAVSPRSYYPEVDDPELEAVLMRPQEIPRYVGAGNLDAGLSGKDWVLENAAEVVTVCDLAYSKATAAPARWVLAVAADSRLQTVADLQGKRIATELVQVTKDYLARAGVEAAVEFSWGATEMKVPELVDAVVELTETGSSLRAHNLRVLDTVLHTNAQLIACPAAWADDWKRTKTLNLATLLQGALLAERKVGLKMNVARSHLPGVLGLLPALKGPTVSPLAEDDWVAVETIVDEQVARELIPQLLSAGAQGIIEYPLNKVIP